MATAISLDDPLASLLFAIATAAIATFAAVSVTTTPPGNRSTKQRSGQIFPSYHSCLRQNAFDDLAVDVG